MTCRNVASGRDRRTSTVLSSITFTPDSESASPDATASYPSIEPKKPAPGLCVSGFVTRSSEYFTSSAVISRPLWKVTPSRSVNVKVIPSSEIA